MLARALHAALAGGTVIVAAVAWFVRGGMADPPPDLPLLRYIALATSGAGLAVAWLVRSRVEPASGGVGDPAWWKANLGRCIVVWAQLDFVGILGAVVYLITGHLASAVVIVTAALAGFALFTPSRLAGE